MCDARCGDGRTRDQQVNRCQIQLPPVHEPSLAPDEPPGVQRFVVRHQPQPGMIPHSRQLPAMPQNGVVELSVPESRGVPASTGGAVHCVDVHAQSLIAHAPPVGPDEVPVWQRPAVRHQPHDAPAVHVPQVDAAQGSLTTSAGGVPLSVAVAVHCDETHAQSLVAHAPPIGPVEVPVKHRPSDRHQPHDAPAVHVPHVAAPQGSAAASVGTVGTSAGGVAVSALAPLSLTPPPHCDRVHDQSLAPHVPSAGPVAVPGRQRPAAPHQPHAAAAVHVSHVAPVHAEAAESAGGIAASTGGVAVSTVTVSAVAESLGTASLAAPSRTRPGSRGSGPSSPIMQPTSENGTHSEARR